MPWSKKDTMLKKFPSVLRRILEQRGISGDEALLSFLYPTLQELPDPWLMQGMSSAVDLIEKALGCRDIVIYGDYDVDGVTGTALLYLFLKKLTERVGFIHSDRKTHGYGLHVERIDAIASEYNAPLLITVDCGIADFSAVAHAQSHGCRVIVTDHHIPPEKIPEADAILNPLQQGCAFPYKSLAGVGVVFYLLIALRQRLREKGAWQKGEEPNLKEALGLVALGSIADMVPLVGLNRVLVRAGIESLQSGKYTSKGLKALFEKGRLTGREIEEEGISYKVAPLVNAAGRIGAARLATELLICDDADVSSHLAEKLYEINRERKRLVQEQGEEAMSLARELKERGKKGIVLYNSSWHIGVIGIIAARVCDEIQLPVIIFAGEEDLKGSARAPAWCNLYNLLDKCKASLNTFGGHRSAAGASVNVLNLNGFSETFESECDKKHPKSSKIKVVVDGIIPSTWDDDQFFEQYTLLKPFGQGNPEPKFCLDKPTSLRNVKVVGMKNDHVSFEMSIMGKTIRGIGFSFAHSFSQLANEQVSPVFTFSKNWFRGRGSWQVRLYSLDS